MGLLEWQKATRTQTATMQSSIATDERTIGELATTHYVKKQQLDPTNGGDRCEQEYHAQTIDWQDSMRTRKVVGSR